MEFAGMEGWLVSGIVFCLPFVILITFIKLFLFETPPRNSSRSEDAASI
jgi:hypothetical protein